MLAIATTTAFVSYGMIQYRLGSLTPNPAWAGASQNLVSFPKHLDFSQQRQPRLNLLGLILDRVAPAPATPSTPAIATVSPQPIAHGQLAATLYLHQRPILTFVGTTSALVQGPVPSAMALAPATTPFLDRDPLRRATALADRLNQLPADQRHRLAATIDVIPSPPSPGAETVAYQIRLQGQPLLSWDSQTRSPNPTYSPAKDALQLANQLRHGLGQVQPLTAIGPSNAAPMAPDAVANATAALLDNPESSPGINRAINHAINPQPTSQVLGEALASWYGPGFHGRLTANGEIYDQHAFTAAHRDLPFDTQLRVTNLMSGKSVVVRVNDRGPYVDGRDIDLSAGAAEALGSSHSGVVPVRLEILE